MAFKDTFLKITLQALYEQSVLANTVDRVASTAGVRAVGGSVEIESPLDFGTTVPDAQTQDARDADTPLVRRKPVQTSRSITLSDFLYLSLAVPYDLNTMSDINILTQLGQPAAEIIGGREEKSIANTLRTAPQVAPEEVVAGADAEAVLANLRLLRRKLNAGGAPNSNRYAAVGSGVADALLSSDRFLDASARADSGLALKEATIGRVYGFDIVENAQEPGSPGSIVAYHKSALKLVGKPLAPSRAALESGELVASNGAVLGYHIGYEAEYASDRITVGYFPGFDLVRPAHSARLLMNFGA